MQTEKRSRPHWGEMSPAKRASIIVAGVIQFCLLAAALWDLRRRPPEMVRGDKRIWAGIAFINYFGPISYFIIGRRR